MKELENSGTGDVRLPDSTGAVLSGGDERGYEGPVQPAVQPEGSPSARERKPAPKETEGHKVTQEKAASDLKHDKIGLGRNLAKHDADETHVHADNPSAKQREAYVKGERERKDDKVFGESKRTTMKEAFAGNKP